MRLICILILCISPLAWAKNPTPVPLPSPLTPAVFSHQQILLLSESSPFYRLDVPITVYQFSQRADLGDLRVFNAAGELVPYALETRAAPQQNQLSQTSLRFFPYDSKASIEQRDISIQIRSDGQLSAQSHTFSKQQESSYIVDASQIKGQLESLILGWQEANYQGQIRLAASDDLQQWQALGSTEIIQLDYQGQTLSQPKVELGGIRAKYLRISSDTPLTLKEVRLQSSIEQSAPAKRAWLAPVTAQLSQDEYLFDLGVHAPIDRLEIALPQLNTVVQASLASRATPAEPWQNAQSGVLYRLQGKTAEAHSPALSISPNNHRYWRLSVNQNSGGLGQGLPQLKAGWTPQQIAFVARGQAPFTLSFGNMRVNSAAINSADLIIGNAVASAVAGALQNKTTPLAPAIASEPSSARSYGLWAALVLAVGVLGGMAWKLIRPAQG
ncbi:DUF3999 domain-containing protein [Janthinobacterium sp. B9-8]|uniref:DUF3999 domain-containing protein n=1 Tax=Janthinobacterium sp. B9-8 TaxID=1236179 RepID=UPI00061D0CC4|nr:DUF3999 domain-containing protein [Janthinobacterium sp. B9-8]AMC34703.1 hypothetical protein VN23_08830 [Janthinobacterium sp. B9-8]